MSRPKVGLGYIQPTAIVGRRENVARSHRGAWAEALAVVWLIENGYEVFTNVSAHGPIDMIAVKDGVPIFIDVKTLSVMPVKSGVSISHQKLSPLQEEIGVRHLLVHPEGEIYWDEVDVA